MGKPDARVSDAPALARGFAMTWFAIVSMLGCGTPVPAPGPPCLYGIEEVKDAEGVVRTRGLVRIAPTADGRAEKATLIVLDQRFFGHFGGCRLVEGRFVVTKYGGVIDLMTNKVVNDEIHGDLLGVERRKVVYRVDNAYRENGIFAFDLATFRVAKITAPGHWALPGVKSPDNVNSVSQGPDGAVVIHGLDGTSRDFGGDFRVDYSPLASFLPATVPFLWLDRNRVLTQTANGKLVVLDATGGASPLVNIPNTPRVLSPTRLWYDADRRLVYSCGDEEYLIDAAAKTWRKLEWYSLGHGFEASVAEDEGGVHQVRHNGATIGRWAMNPYQAKTSAGRVAFAYLRPGRNLGEPDGVALWDRDSGHWRTVSFWPNSLVGWGTAWVRPPG
jgi:hypothetical protein